MDNFVVMPTIVEAFLWESSLEERKNFSWTRKKVEKLSICDLQLYPTRISENSDHSLVLLFIRIKINDKVIPEHFQGMIDNIS